MKSLFVLLVPMLLFAQTEKYPDKIITVRGVQYPCVITRLDRYTIKIKYGKDSETSVSLNGVGEIYLGTDGLVYTSESGFNDKLENIQEIIEKRKNKNNIRKENISGHDIPRYSSIFLWRILYSKYYNRIVYKFGLWRWKKYVSN
jgi:hypothetical protein